MLLNKIQHEICTMCGHSPVNHLLYHLQVLLWHSGHIQTSHLRAVLQSDVQVLYRFGKMEWRTAWRSKCVDIIWTDINTFSWHRIHQKKVHVWEGLKKQLNLGQNNTQIKWNGTNFIHKVEVKCLAFGAFCRHDHFQRRMQEAKTSNQANH